MNWQVCLRREPPGRVVRTLFVLASLAPLAVSAQETPPPASAPVAPGHSVHGESFNEGPRQRAYLLGTTGDIQFSVSTANPLAQAYVNQGVGALHGFWYFEAERSFRQAAALDPNLAMAYWGMSLANINNERRAKGFIAEAVKRKAGVTPREAMYIDAWDAYLKSDNRKERGTKYARDLERILYDYPDDVDARAFLALQMWLNRNSGVPIPSYLATNALLDEVFRAKPMHPAHHYRIHLWDGERPEFALDSAAKCGASAPGIAHMWHMSGHIYSGLRRYPEAAWQQEASARVDHAHMMRDRILPDQIHNFAHNNEWLIRDLSHIGRVRDAADLARNMVELPRHPTYNTLGYGSAHYGRARLFEVLERFELWDQLLADGRNGYLEPTDDEGEQVKRLRTLARACFRMGDPCGADEFVRELDERRASLRQQRQAAVAAAESQARQENKEAAEVEKRKTEAGRPFDGRLNALERAYEEIQGFLALEAGDPAKALTWIQKSGGNNQAFIARLQFLAGQHAEAEKTLRQSVNSHENETAPLAQAVWLFDEFGNAAAAREMFDKLREISGHLDLDAPIFARLAPIAADFGYPEDWRIKKPFPPDFGERPSLDSLGPFRWQPSPAASFALLDADGKTVSLAHYEGKPVVVIFYLGYGCLHCVEQLKAFAPRAQEFADAGFQIVTISTDAPEDLRKALASYDQPVPFPLLSDAGLETFRAYRCVDDFENRPLHGTFIIDGRGLVRWQDIGHQPFMNVDFVLKEGKRLCSPTLSHTVAAGK